MAVMDGKGLSARENLNIDVHPFWSVVSLLDTSGSGARLGDYVWIDPAIWDMDYPSFSCALPCYAKIPPWKGGTSTVNYPLLTVSDGAWTSAITKALLTITEWVFEPAKVTVVARDKRQIGIQPTPATTPFWPAVVYHGKDGSASTIEPTVAFPLPPATMPTGSWPKREVILHPTLGQDASPTVDPCGFVDYAGCIQHPWLGGNMGEMASEAIPTAMITILSPCTASWTRLAPPAHAPPPPRPKSLLPLLHHAK